MRKLAAFKPWYALRIALRETPRHEIHIAYHSIARGLVAVAALPLEKVAFRIARDPLEPQRRIGDRCKLRTQGTPCQTRIGSQCLAIGAGNILVNGLGIFAMRR